jgi:tRNA A-37 threonylcarbamoyl transferase component Bud32
MSRDKKDKSELQPGATVGGRYEVVQYLGSGAVGVVYKVKQVFLNREFALKMLNRNAVSEAALVRFQREARTSFAIDHPAIVKVHDFGLLEDDLPFLVMELLQGETLSERIARTGPLSVEEVIPIFIQICFGLNYAHEQDVVHRDIKPGNIMLLANRTPGDEGSVKIVDFGIAKFTKQGEYEAQALTRTGEIFGSPLYMSPEQCSGLKVDSRTDIYSLGCTFYECLTGSPPLCGPDILSTLVKHQTEVAPTLKESSLGREFPQELENIVAKMLAKEPGQRYQRLSQTAFDLGAFQRGDKVSVSTPAVTIVSPAPANSSSSFNLSLLLAGALVLLVALAVPIWIAFGPQKTPATEAHTSADVIPANPFPLVDIPYKPLSTEELKDKVDTAAVEGVLELNNRFITADNFTYMAKRNVPFHSLSILSSKIDNHSLGLLAKIPLRRVNFSTTDFDDIGASQLFACTSLDDLALDNTELTDEGVTKYIVRMKNLKRLNLSGDNIGNESLHALGKVRALEVLYLGNNASITDDSFILLENSSISRLGLESPYISNKGIYHVAKMKNLKALILRNSRVDPAGLAYLCQNCKSLQNVIWMPTQSLQESDIARLKREFPKISFFHPEQKRL